MSGREVFGRNSIGGPKSVKAKVCGITSLMDLQLCVAAGADALGFLVRTRESRPAVGRLGHRLAISSAARLVRAVPPSVASVLLIHVSTAEAVAELCRQIRPAAIQVQRDIREGDLRVVKEEFPEIRIVKTVHVYPDSAESEICARVSEDLEGEVVDAINLDSRESKSNQQTGGTGLTHDWNISASVVRRIGSGRVILAGGLTAENVRRAIETVGPGAVDVMSGVEDESGVKNPLKVQAFFGALRT